MAITKKNSKKSAKKAARGRARAKTRRTAGALARRKIAALPTPAERSRRVRATPETLRLGSVSPSFTVNDIEKSLAWYRDVMGFVVKHRWEEEGKLTGVELLAGGVEFMLAQDDWKKGRDRVKGEGFRLYCTTAQDVDRIAEQIEARGGAVAQGPTDQPWGMRDIAVEDPDGFKITIGAPAKR
jgi:uncharacterized glyoxalase superfamily protein PhnB